MHKQPGRTTWNLHSGIMGHVALRGEKQSGRHKRAILCSGMLGHVLKQGESHQGRINRTHKHSGCTGSGLVALRQGDRTFDDLMNAHSPTESSGSGAQEPVCCGGKNTKGNYFWAGVFFFLFFFMQNPFIFLFSTSLCK